MRVEKHWQRTPREGVDAPSPEVLKARLDWALNDLVKWKESMGHQGRLELDEL